jgi:hypothetical protein
MASVANALDFADYGAGESSILSCSTVPSISRATSQESAGRAERCSARAKSSFTRLPAAAEVRYRRRVEVAQGQQPSRLPAGGSLTGPQSSGWSQACRSESPRFRSVLSPPGRCLVFSDELWRSCSSTCWRAPIHALRGDPRFDVQLLRSK